MSNSGMITLREKLLAKRSAHPQVARIFLFGNGVSSGNAQQLVRMLAAPLCHLKGFLKCGWSASKTDRNKLESITYELARILFVADWTALLRHRSWQRYVQCGEW